VSAYDRRVGSLIARLALLVAVLFVPLGMAVAPASATPAAHHAQMPMEHCPRQAPAHHQKAGFAECTMACAAALPAVDARRDASPTIVCAPEIPATARRLDGLHPDTATPPPKRT
jgi:hypothetical protein